MDWSKVKAAVGQIAPWIAGTLGSPVAGVAVKALCDVFGLSGVEATPDNVALRLAGATPAQLTDLRLAEQKHEEFMLQIGYSHIEQLEQITAEDRNSARDREKAVHDNTPKVLAALAIMGFISLIVYTATGHAPEQTMHDTFMMLTGASVALAKDVYGYYFGSSAGSQAKDATITKLTGE